MTHQPLRVGLVGCGNISAVYLANARRFRSFDIIALCDRDPARAAASAAEHGIPAATWEAMLADRRIELILNLTPPATHAQIGMAALRAGRHLYSEKPLAIDREDARRMIDLAAERGLLIGAAPDTVMGAGLRTCRELIDRGEIGEPVAAACFMMYRGPESWHPDPEFFYQPGAGPLLDMGPYHLTALVNLIGPVRRVSAFARASFPTRLITSPPRRGDAIAVRTPTHIAGTLELEGGALATMVMSFDVCGHTLPPMEVYGSEATIQVPDPNGFGGPVRILRRESEHWQEVPVELPYADNSRGIGLCDLARAIRTGTPHLASGRLAAHVLDAAHGMLESAGSARELAAHSPRPPALPPSWREDDWMG